MTIFVNLMSFSRFTVTSQPILNKELFRLGALSQARYGVFGKPLHRFWSLDIKYQCLSRDFKLSGFDLAKVGLIVLCYFMPIMAGSMLLCAKIFLENIHLRDKIVLSICPSTMKRQQK